MASPPVLEDPALASRRAKTRIGVALVLLAIAIGGLSLLSQRKPEKQLEETSPSRQESISSGGSTTQTPLSQAPAQINSAQQEPLPPPVTKTPAEPPPPPPPPAPTVSQLPPETQHSAAPATPRSVTPAKPTDKATPLPPPAQEAAVPARSAPEKMAAEKPVIEKVAQKIPAKAEPTPKAFVVQVGVFTDMENAKQLQAKLAEHGIPSHTETKLQVGPFASKTEADAAQAKLKAIGMGAVIVPVK